MQSRKITSAKCVRPPVNRVGSIAVYVESTPVFVGSIVIVVRHTPLCFSVYFNLCELYSDMCRGPSLCKG
jgi:hypothetical protein